MHIIGVTHAVAFTRVTNVIIRSKKRIQNPQVYHDSLMYILQRFQLRLYVFILHFLASCFKNPGFKIAEYLHPLRPQYCEMSDNNKMFSYNRVCQESQFVYLKYLKEILPNTVSTTKKIYKSVRNYVAYQYSKGENYKYKLMTKR